MGVQGHFLGAMGPLPALEAPACLERGLHVSEGLPDTDFAFTPSLPLR